MKLNKTNYYVIMLVFVLLAVIFIMSMITPYFLSFAYIANALHFVAETGLIALGMALVILTGGIDLSVGSIVALSAVSLGMLTSMGVNVVLSILLVLGIGILAGTFNGLIVCKIKIPPIIVTLATMAAYRGIAIGITAGNAFRVPKSLYFIGQGSIFGIPISFIFFVVVMIIMSVLIHKTNMGISLIAIGYNSEAALFSGLQINKEKIRVYLLSGLFSAIVGIILACRVSSAKADYGTGYELDAITIAVFGGASLGGGKISILGTFLSTIIIVFLRVGLSTAIVPSEVQSILIGLILIFSVAINKFIEYRRSIAVRSSS